MAGAYRLAVRHLPAGAAAVGAVVPRHRAGRADDGARLRRQPVPRRRDLGPRARRGSPLVGGRAARRRRDGEPARTASSPSSRVVVTVLVARAGRPGAGRRGRRRRWCSSSAGAGTCGGRPAIRSCSGRPRTRGTRSRCRRCSPTPARDRAPAGAVPPRRPCCALADPLRASGSGASRPPGPSSSRSACCPPLALGVEGLARYADHGVPDAVRRRRRADRAARRWPAVAVPRRVRRRRWCCSPCSSSAAPGCRDRRSRVRSRANVEFSSAHEHLIRARRRLRAARHRSGRRPLRRHRRARLHRLRRRPPPRRRSARRSSSSTRWCPSTAATAATSTGWPAHVEVLVADIGAPEVAAVVRRRRRRVQRRRTGQPPRVDAGAVARPRPQRAQPPRVPRDAAPRARRRHESCRRRPARCTAGRATCPSTRTTRRRRSTSTASTSWPASSSTSSTASSTTCDVTVLRLTNVYGPRQHLEREGLGFLPVFVRRALLGEDIVLYGDGTQRRDCLLRRRRRRRAAAVGARPPTPPARSSTSATTTR